MKQFLSIILVLAVHSVYSQASLGIYLNNQAKINHQGKSGIIVLKNASNHFKKNIGSKVVFTNIPSGEYLIEYYKAGYVKLDKKVYVKNNYLTNITIDPSKLDSNYTLKENQSLTFVDSSYNIWEVEFQNMNSFNLTSKSVNFIPKIEIKGVYWHGILYDTINPFEFNKGTFQTINQIIKINNIERTVSLLKEDNAHINVDRKLITAEKFELIEGYSGLLSIHFTQDSLAYIKYTQHFDTTFNCIKLFKAILAHYKNESSTTIKPMVIEGNTNKNFFNSQAFMIEFEKSKLSGNAKYVVISCEPLSKPIINKGKLSLPSSEKCIFSIEYYK